ncbi:MAG: efflux RND transporter periplasmic adaptor subunit [Opitutaceae bacterium]|nr:efflux RND transporter periplasmic adaptor subunit [Verrucomicrobiales bacterium]
MIQPSSFILRACLTCAATSAALFLTACSPASDPAKRVRDPELDKPRPVKTARVEERRLQRGIVALGTLGAREDAILSVKVPGRVAEVLVDLGSVVQAGDVIARVDDTDYNLKMKQAAAALSQARARLALPLEGDNDQVDADKTSLVKESKARLDEAEKNRDRILKLGVQGIASQSEQETANATYEVAFNRYGDSLEEVRIRQAQLTGRRVEFEIARQQLEDCTLRAPFPGVVQERRATRGEYLVAGTPVATLVRIDPLRLRVEVPERDASLVAIGQPVQVTVEGLTNLFLGEVKRLSPALQVQNRMLTLEADVPSQNLLRPGSFARARITTIGSIPALVIPSTALVSFAGIEKAFIIEDGKAVEKRIVTGDRGSDWIEVVNGLKAGVSVILSPGNLQNSQVVTVSPTLAVE